LATPFQAFGRTGDLETAFELIDEMRQNHVPVTHETFDFLLQGCISDKEVGFRHALITWRMMRQKQVWPRIHNYNLILKAAYDCKMGDVKHTKDILIACLPAPEREKKRKNEKVNVAPSINQLKTSDSDSFLELVTQEEKDLQLARIESVQPMPNLLSKRPQIGKNIINMSGDDSKESRLMVMGGVSGLLELMKKTKWNQTSKHLTRCSDSFRIQRKMS